MLYLSQVLGAPVEDQQNERVGRIVDVLVPVGSEAPPYPSALLVEGEEDLLWRVSPEAVERREGTMHLHVPLTQLTRYVSGSSEHEISLAQEVFDKQVIDIKRKKPVRVNDVCFDDDWRILGVDNSTFGLVRRLAPAWLLGGKERHRAVTHLPWERVELIASDRSGQSEGENREPASALGPPSRTPSGHLADLHPADIAEIVQQLTAVQGARLIERLDDETAADTMEEIGVDRQLQILENIQPDRAADILQTMGPDEAADLLAQMSDERAQALLQLMTPEESEDVQELLTYEADTAGGLMTTDYLVLNRNKTVGEALEAIRANIQEKDVRTAYVYCVADEDQEEQHILGVVSLWDLLVATPTQVLDALMETDVISVQADSDPHSVAEIMAKYNLLAVPVVNEGGFLQGIITVDDVLDVLLPPEQRRRPNRLY